MFIYRIFTLLLASLLVGICAGFENPIRASDGSDPFMVYHEGYYYLTTTTWTDIQITRGTTMQELIDATPKTVWTDTTAARCCNIWAPEIHWKATEGAWYIYYVAGTSDSIDNQYIFALKGSATIIWDSTWSFASRIAIPNRDVWSIDPTVLLWGGNEYLVYSSWDGDLQCLYIAEFSNAITVGDAVQISCPTLSWEDVGSDVNEGPAPLYYGGKTWLTYSASSCATSSYSLGQLELTGSNPMVESSWTKVTSGPVFSSANGLYGTGHNGFFLSDTGDETWLVYHYSTSSAVACDGTRRTAVQPISFSSSVEPVFGTPDTLTTELAEPA